MATSLYGIVPVNVMFHLTGDKYSGLDVSEKLLYICIHI